MANYYHDPRFKKKRLTDAKKMILYMLPRCLTGDEFSNLSALTKEAEWCDERALTSHIAQTFLGVGFFHSRRPNIVPTLEKYKLPFRLVQIAHPEGICELYFLAYIGDSEPPNVETVSKLLGISDIEDDNRDFLLFA